MLSVQNLEVVYQDVILVLRGVSFEIPKGKIAAGTPVEAIQNEVSRIPLPSNLEKNGDYFGLKVQGDSMIEAGIKRFHSSTYRWY